MSTGKRDTKAIGAQLPKPAIQKVRQAAIEESADDEVLNQSDIIRRALSEYCNIPMDELEP
jgi:hypothetical protein